VAGGSSEPPQQGHWGAARLKKAVSLIFDRSARRASAKLTLSDKTEELPASQGQQASDIIDRPATTVPL